MSNKTKLAIADELLGDRVLCDCQECVVNGVRRALHRPQDCEYTRRRSALIPKAVAIADERVPYSAMAIRWTREFALAMDQLLALERR